MMCDKNRGKMRIPLAERLQSVQGRFLFPRAAGLRDVDFFYTIGEMTGDKARYDHAYETYIRAYGGTEETRVNVIDLIQKAEQLDGEAQGNLLYWTLVEPFATLLKLEEKTKKSNRKESEE